MVTIVLIGNALIALICLGVAWQLWQLKKQLAAVADTLLDVEAAVHNTLYGAPKAIMSGQVGIRQLRQNYQGLKPQLQRARQAIALLSLGQTLWQRRSVLPLRSRNNRRSMRKLG